MLLVFYFSHKAISQSTCAPKRLSQAWELPSGVQCDVFLCKMDILGAIYS